MRVKLIDGDLDLDFNFPEVDQMESIPWYKTIKEAEEEAQND